MDVVVLGLAAGSQPVHHVENTWIPLPDGARPAARIWMPEDASSNPVPAIVEYIPYRKRDGLRLRDETMHPYFAAHGYASIRVDLRGSGDSDGVLTDEYLPQELDDGVEVIRWLAGQHGCWTSRSRYWARRRWSRRSGRSAVP